VCVIEPAYPQPELNTTLSAPGEPVGTSRVSKPFFTHPHLQNQQGKLTTSVNPTLNNGELVPRGGDLEVEALVVVVAVRVVVAADLLVCLEVFAALGDGGGDLAGGVALCWTNWLDW
jgi:hypothetical protein